MASIKLANFIVAIAGKTAGTVFAKNKGGAYQRVWVKPTNPRSTSQNLVRNTFTALSQLWRTLLESERTSWIQGAVNFPVKNRLGDTIYLSGNALFVSLNKNLNDIGITTPLTVCPAPMETVPIDYTSAVADNSSNTLVVTLGGALDANVTAKVFATPSLSAGISSPGTKLRQIGIINTASGATPSLTADYTAMFGAVGAVGDKIFLELVPVNQTTGQIGSIVRATVIIVA